jgi:acyl-lipid omega-6 desaturase (Delta-12 desaturase)
MQNPVIRVLGNGKVATEPDVAVLSFTMKAEDKEYGRAVDQLNTRSAVLREPNSSASSGRFQCRSTTLTNAPKVLIDANSMRTGQALILATKRYASDSPVKSWWHLFSTLVLLGMALGGTIWADHPAAKLVCSFLSGLLVLRMFVIYHDQQHHAILPRSRLAEYLMRVFGVLVLSASSVWRTSHNHHHNHNSKLRGSRIGSFPVMTRTQFESASASDRFKYLSMRHPLTILFGYFPVFLFGMCINPFVNDPKRHFDCLLALLVHIVIAMMLVALWGWQQLLLTQSIPHFVACAIGSYLFYAQHNFPGVSFKDKGGWTYEKAALESSSFIKTNPVMAWFTGNIGYHHVHHLNAKIPFYRLPEVVQDLPELQSPRTTSLHPGDIMKCLRLKVWDAERQRMIGLREMTEIRSPAVHPPRADSTAPIGPGLNA